MSNRAYSRRLPNNDDDDDDTRARLEWLSYQLDLVKKAADDVVKRNEHPRQTPEATNNAVLHESAHDIAKKRRPD